jgi:hypothetical protein
VTTRYVFTRVFLSFFRSTGRGLGAFSLPAFFGRFLGNSLELREQRDYYRELYEQERRYTRELMDRWLERQGARPVYSEAPPQVIKPPATQILSQPEWEQADEKAEVEEEAMMASSDPERMALAKEAALENPEWARVVKRAEAILTDSASAPVYGESSDWPA